MPILRVSLGTGQTIIRNDIIRFEGQYIPKEILSAFVGPPGSLHKTLFTGRLETAELLNTIDETEFALPSDAVPAPKLITLDEEKTKPQLIRHPVPVYPPIARAAHVSGTVVLNVIIMTSGDVTSLKVISGPAMLIGAALNAVKTWKYKSFLENGSPVEVESKVTTVFTLSP